MSVNLLRSRDFDLQPYLDHRDSALGKLSDQHCRHVSRLSQDDFRRGPAAAAAMTSRPAGASVRPRDPGVMTPRDLGPDPALRARAAAAWGDFLSRPSR